MSQDIHGIDLYNVPDEEALLAALAAIEVTTGAVGAGATGAGGWDVTVTIRETPGPEGYWTSGDVTLIRDEWSGEPVSWGEPSCWIGPMLLSRIQRLAAQPRFGSIVWRDLLDRLKTAALAAIEASGVEPARGEHEEG